MNENATFLNAKSIGILAITCIILSISHTIGAYKICVTMDQLIQRIEKLEGASSK